MQKESDNHNECSLVFNKLLFFILYYIILYFIILYYILENRFSKTRALIG